jgi:hypothetical protein
MMWISCCLSGISHLRSGQPSVEGCGLASVMLGGRPNALCVLCALCVVWAVYSAPSWVPSFENLVKNLL